MDNWRNLIYDSYVTNLFGDSHSSKKSYDLNYRYFRKNYDKYIPRSDARILELGCGMGHFTYYCKRMGYRNYVGIDASPENIAFVKKIMKSANVSVQDMFSFLETAEGECYDVVVFNDVIEHLNKSEIFDVLIGVKRILSRGGVFLIKTPNMANPFVSTAGRYICFDHEIGFTEGSMREILRATGYSDIQIKGTDIYVLNPIISILAKLISKLVNAFLFLLSALYGRTSIKIFEKDIMAIAYKR